MSAARKQFCDYCGEPLGFFAHSRRLDGPLTCNSAECCREAAHDERQAELDARERAEADDYAFYR